MAATGASYNLILDHILTYQSGYEIPLRTMYTINCTPRAQPLPQRMRRNGSMASIASSGSDSPTSVHFPTQGEPVTQQLTSKLMAQMAELPTSPTSLPPSFITSFVRKCFAADLRFVDFPQALTGLDYLKDLETRRRKEVAASLERLGIDRETLGTAEDDLSARFPGVLAWFRSLEGKERKIEALYTQLYVGLRRWVLINELSLTPFNKHNCVAMLNTLYPPVVSSQPTSKLTPTILKNQRDGFFKYIQGVEKSGPKILVNLMQQGRKADEENGWPAVRNTLELYLMAANSVLSECIEVSDVTAFRPTPELLSTKRQGRKVDSGISFTGSDARRPSSSGSSKSSTSSEQSHESTQKPSLVRTTTTLEKIARELKHIGRNRTEVEEMIKPVVEPVTETQPKVTGLRKIRSFGNLGSLRSANGSSTSLHTTTTSRTEVPAFDVEEMKRQRLVYESRQARIHLTAMSLAPM
ncbi:hypothetical protein MBLNU459_g6809t2 [Dothideomycetes sp. NU459]